ncbi:MAG: UDP-N-acetylglucosamine 2-epimerase (non-hydrolyzing) [Nitrososphaeraceae archaeon]|nr:UDP-N-acetylglucosamine 2-epimerase (non-hydrolyzing) [Nitrososphaeraceae archaeon]
MFDNYIVVTGTRPEIIKMAPVIRRLMAGGLRVHFVHTGQHYDYLLSKQMLKDLQLPKPYRSFVLRSNSPAAQIGEIMSKLERPFRQIAKKSILLIQGDTNSVVSAALTGVKVGIPIAHVEAGLRSYDWRMPEEHNRRMVDHISDILFAPTETSRVNLEMEKVHGEIFVTGNTIIDAVREHLPIAMKKSKVMNNIRFKEYVLVTIHRAENVDSPRILGEILEGLIRSNVPLVIPIHPRTQERLRANNYSNKLASKNIQILSPQGYLDFLVLLKNSRFVVTDSGGIQEEATSPSLLKRVFVIRDSTERPEAVASGIVKLLSISRKHISSSIHLEWHSDQPKRISIRKSPYGAGYASDKIMRILLRKNEINKKI